MVAKTKRNLKKRTANLNDNITIDGKHSEMIDHFKNLDDSIPDLKEQLRKTIIEYNKKDNRLKSDIDYILHREKLKEKINFLQKQIQQIHKKDEINKYYLDAGLLLLDYYKNMEDSKTSDVVSSDNFEKNLLNYNKKEDDDDLNGVLENIEEDDDEEDDDDDNEEGNDEIEEKKGPSVLSFFKPELQQQQQQQQNSTEYSSTKISDFVKEESKYKKKDMLEEYLQ